MMGNRLLPHIKPGHLGRIVGRQTGTRHLHSAQQRTGYCYTVCYIVCTFLFTLSSDCRYRIVTLLLHGCYTFVTLFLQCCYTAVKLLHSWYTTLASRGRLVQARRRAPAPFPSRPVPGFTVSSRSFSAAKTKRSQPRHFLKVSFVCCLLSLSNVFCLPSAVCCLLFTSSRSILSPSVSPFEFFICTPLILPRSLALLFVKCSPPCYAMLTTPP
jgi:hypothetical protein